MHLGGLDMKYIEKENLKRIKLGDYIKKSTSNNGDLKYGEEFIVGVSNKGIFTEPKGNVSGVNLKPYKIVNKGAFVYNPSRLDLGSIAYRTDEVCIVSHLYQIFYLNEDGKKIINPDYLFMYFRRKEFYREVTFRNFGSQRPEFNLKDMSELEILLPDISIQQKYVDVYNAMLANQQCYERGLEDLKLVCDAYIENLSINDYHPIGVYIERNKKRNQNVTFKKSDVKGFNNEGEFIKPMRLFSGDISTFKVVANGDFVYNSRINSTIKKLSVAFNEEEDLIVSPAYESFYISKENELYPFYLYMLLQREIFAKKVLFNSFGSSTLVFGFHDLGKVEIPVPDIEIQKAIANIYKAYKERRSINEKLKTQIEDIFPILIKGSIEEAKKLKEA